MLVKNSDETVTEGVREMKAAEFFAGIGLVRLALERAGWEVVFANDIDPRKQQMYAANFGESEYKLADIRSLAPRDIPNVRLATASFPCIDLSLAGNRAGLNGSHSGTYWYFLKLLEGMQAKRPPFILLENVMGLLSSHDGTDLEAILLSLNKLGYACDLITVDAAWFTPQSRPRLFVIGTPLASNSSLPVVFDHPARPKSIAQFIHDHPGIYWNFLRLPRLKPTAKRLDQVVQRIPASSPLWWDAKRKAHLFTQMSERHKTLLQEACGSRTKRYLTVYKRVRPAGCRAEVRADGRAGCLRTPRGGSSKQFVIEAQVGGWRVRNMTAREYARLQGVPDAFPITVDENTALLGFGDAVCVPAVTWIIKHCINPGVAKVGLNGRYFGKSA